MLVETQAVELLPRVEVPHPHGAIDARRHTAIAVPQEAHGGHAFRVSLKREQVVAQRLRLVVMAQQRLTAGLRELLDVLAHR